MAEVNFEALASLLYATLAQVGESLDDSHPWTTRINTVVDVFECAVRMHAGDEALVAVALAGLSQVEDIVDSEAFLQK
ncbi:MAG: hypothetical protein AB7G47_01770 [Mycolicibacterium sp.]|uniref:hypothetical protein n=1 Tax=Mycolicibacterium sp. TaxID=2320850 RepID=UPI003D13AE8A